jgi:pyruvate/2-oxoglutarate dehydrogenase complex dihydrolipoamide dehydrogenase (E3) component
VKNRNDLVVIGGGAGGLVVASVAAQLGLRVALVEKSPRLGGDCLHSGCVPSKTLLHTAKVASLMRRGAEFGLDALSPRVNMGRISDHVHAVIDHIQRHDDPERFRAYGCDVLFGPALFTDPYTVQVNGRPLHGRRFVIATGSRPAVPPIPGLDAVAYLTNESVFDLRDLPRRLVVLGGGPIGVELAQAFSRLGSAVCLVERLAELLPHEDPEISILLRQQLASEGVRILTSTTVQRVYMRGQEIHVECDGGNSLQADKLLVATGRKPGVDDLGLEAAGVEYDARGVKVDSRLRTSQKHIFACGDVCGPYQFTHMAEYQAGIVISNAVFRFPKRINYRVVPRVTYTDPELAHVGLTAQEATAQGIKTELLSFPFSGIDRAVAEVEPYGLSKFVTRKGRLLGATILGPHAGELIHELALGMQTGATLHDLSATIHAYPTLAQIHRRTANSGLSGRLFSRGTRRLVKWMNRLVP